MNSLAAIPIDTGFGIGLTMPVVGTIGVDILMLLNEECGHEVDYIVNDGVTTQPCNQCIGIDTGLGNGFTTVVERLVVADEEFLILFIRRTHLNAQFYHAIACVIALQVSRIDTRGIDTLVVVHKR